MHILKMSRWFYILLFIIVFTSCETTTEVTLPSQIAILIPSDGSVLSEQTEMKFSIVNDDNLSFVQIIIDGVELDRFSKGTTEWVFTPAFYNDGEQHTLIAITNDSDDQQNQSEVLSFSVAASAVLSPIYTAPATDHVYTETEEVNLNWQTIPNAEKYTVQISEDKYFGTILSEETVTNTHISFGVLPQKVYYFRLNAENKAGKIATWANYRKIYVGIYDFTWMNVYDFGAGAEWGNDVVALPDSSFITGGPCFDAYMEYSKMSIVKTDCLGNVIWNKLIGAENAVSYVNSIEYSGDYIYVVGGEADPRSYITKLLLIKMDLNGNVIWNKTYGSTDSWGYKAEIGTDGSIYISCDYNSIRSLVKINTDGTLIYNYTPLYSGDWLCFTFDQSDKLLVMYGDYFEISHIVSLNENGEEVSNIGIEGLYIYSGRSIAADNSGIYLSYSSDNITKFDYDGNILYQYSNYDYSYYAMSFVNNSLYLSGYDYYGTAVMLKINTTLSDPVIFPYCTGVLTNLKVMNDGSAILCGTDTDGIYSSSNMLLIRTDKDGNCDNKTIVPNKKYEKFSMLFDRYRDLKQKNDK